MWLLDVKTLELREFFTGNIPGFAILSHTWGLEEVSFVEMKKPKYREIVKRKTGFSKIKGCCIQAQKDGFEWAWVDSCCIDKRSSAELSEAINSMFQWYKLSGRCYVYLSDVPSGSEAIPMLKKSQWFTRGWTLQELLAPQKIVFYAQDWLAIGYKASNREAEAQLGFSSSCINLADELSTITNIPTDFLVGKRALWQACVAQRMFWASRRKTTRAEDRAYSLMGLFDISMPILYGEGLDKAFTRLQREIINTIPDQSILAWYRSDASSYRLLAESPDCFQNSGAVTQLDRRGSLSLEVTTNWSSFSMTNLGLRITLPMTKMECGRKYGFGDNTQATLNCAVKCDDGSAKRISLDLFFFNNDLEGYPIFICHRPREWTFSIGEGHAMSIFLCRNDYIPTLKEEKIVMPTGISEPKSVVPLIMNILANGMGLSYDELVDEMTFAELGADSLTLMIISSRIHKEAGLKISIWTFYEYPTIGDFKAYLTGGFAIQSSA